MQKGNINEAFNLLTNNMGHDIFPVHQKIISQFLLNHSQKSCASEAQ